MTSLKRSQTERPVTADRASVVSTDGAPKVHTDDFYMRRFRSQNGSLGSSVMAAVGPPRSEGPHHITSTPGVPKMGVRARIADWPPRKENVKESSRSSQEIETSSCLESLSSKGSPVSQGSSVSLNSNDSAMLKSIQNTLKNKTGPAESMDSRFLMPEAYPSSPRKALRRIRQRSNSDITISELDVDSFDECISPTYKSGPSLHREYGSTSSIDKQGTSGDSFFDLLKGYKDDRSDRGPTPTKLSDFLITGGGKGSGFSLDVIDGPISQRENLRLFKEREKPLKRRSKSETGDSSIFRKLRNAKGEELGKSSDLEDNRSEDSVRPWTCPKCFAHYDVQSILFDLNEAIMNRHNVIKRRNTTTGASAAAVASLVSGPLSHSASFSSPMGSTEDLNSKGSLGMDQGDDKSNELVMSCPYFRNEIGGEGERKISLSKSNSGSFSGCESTSSGKRKKSSPADLQKITKLLTVKSEDVLAQSPLSKLRGSECWWTRSLRNKVICLDHKKPKAARGCPPKGLPKRHLRVMLTNVLWTDLGREFRKTLPRKDANLCAPSKVQSDSLPSTSVDSIETCQRLDPLHQSLNLSERTPRVILTDIRQTELGRKYLKIPPVTEASLSDTANLKSEQLSSSSDGSLESCQSVNHHKSFLSESGPKPSRTGDVPAKEAACGGQKQGDDGGVTPEMAAPHPKDFNTGNKGCDYLEEGTSNKNTSYSYSEMDHTPVSRKRKKRGRSNFHDSHNSKTSLDKPTEHTKEEENDSSVSRKLEESGEDSHQDPAPPEGLAPESLESEATNLRSFAAGQEPDASAASGRASSPNKSLESSASSEVSENSSVAVKGEALTLKEASPPGGSSEESQLLISAEPIVVSSDEEGPVEHKNSVILKLQPPHEIMSENQGTSDPQLSELTLGACESVQVTSELFPYNPDVENISCIKSNSEMDLKLDFIFTCVYIGKIKGTPKGCVTFTKKYIKIPFQVSTNEISLTVDTARLKRFGLWESKDEDHSKRSHAILFLWLSSDYLQDIQTQLENPMLSQQSKANEFIFLELNSSISQREELKLKDIMMEISTKNGNLHLSCPLPWVQALPLFQDLSPQEISFLHYYYASASALPTAAGADMKKKSVSQPSNSDTIKPTYTFLHKQSSGCYSLSITSSPEEEWQEVRNTGPVQKLIVYPPPPTKGGLGVTNEDLECLEEGEFLNDVIIDFYLKYLLLEKASDELVERSHIFSSFFYKCLTRKENNLTEDNPDLSVAQRRHRRVRTWTRHINIFNKDYIFVPVNESSHWYLAVICFPWLEEAVYEDCPQTVSQQFQGQQSQHDHKMTDNDPHTTSTVSTSAEDSQSTEVNMSVPKKMCKRPCILILDSLKAASIQNTVQNLREYLEVEWEVKRKTHREFSKTNMVDLCPKVPKQDNSSDCGVYLLQYVESFFQDPIVNFELPIHLEKWFPRHVIKTKREDIRELILKLHLQQQKGGSC